MTSAAKTPGGIRTQLTVVGGTMAVIALILCVTALLISGNPLYFVFGLIAVSLAGIIASLTASGRGE
ncbi:MAG: hypothetical protein GYA46_05575 [candidate division Zixibacteria bacterium]|nr:hypothetical protein [candidate division Zixibacteria bacterium]